MRSAPRLLIAIALVALGMPHAARGQDRLDRAITQQTSALSDAARQEVSDYVDRWLPEGGFEAGDDVQAVSEAAQQLIDPLLGSPSAEFLSVYRRMLGPRLSGAFQSDRDEVRLNVMVMVARLQDPALVDLVAEGLRDGNPAVRYWAGRAAAGVAKSLPDDNSRQKLVDALIQALVAERGHQVLPQLAQALLQLPGETAQIGLLEALNRRVPWHTEHPEASLSAQSRVLRDMGRGLAAGPSIAPELLRKLALVSCRYMRLAAQNLDSGIVPPRLMPELKELLDYLDQNLRWLTAKEHPNLTLPQVLQRAIKPLLDAQNWRNIDTRAREWEKLLIQEFQFKPEDMDLSKPAEEAAE